MSKVRIDFTNSIGKIKPMHAVNNGPARENAVRRDNFKTFKELKIPYSRNHDAGLSEDYGGGHVVDVHNIFTDFSRDVDDEEAYDFALTDEYTRVITAAGAEVFYRLGTSIEHWKKKYGSIMPADFGKWAKICEHIIRHYTEGWASGYHYNIAYWEIWNEPDLDSDNCTDKRCWSGTRQEFLEFYTVVAKYLKNKFPDLKIGGPASAGNENFMREFLRHISQKHVQLDFFSWHIYSTDPSEMMMKAERVKTYLDEFGYSDAESILNEWNYIEDWEGKKFLDSIKVIKGMKGAAFAAAVMCAGQHCPVLDMLMYYDARNDKEYNGLYSSDTLEPIKGYYSFKMFSELYQIGEQTLSESDDKEIYVVSAANSEKQAALICYYTMNEDAGEKMVQVEMPEAVGFECYLLDASTNCEKVELLHDNQIVMHPNTVVLLKKS